MIFEQIDPPRCFVVGNAAPITMKDCGAVALQPNEQLTFTTPAGAEYDVARKEWGFYATPSLNGRLENFGLRAVLIRNTITGRYFVLLVERGKESAFQAYMTEEGLMVISWLDSTEALDKLRSALQM